VYLPEIEQQLERQARETAEQGAAIARDLGFEVETHTPSDSPLWRGIVALADEVDAGAIVVGARGLSAVKSALIGSTSNGVVHHTTRPVLVVHAP
jgi:nucleotide-binding universal stress UspA family protein